MCERETSVDCLIIGAPTGDGNHNLGTRPDRESNPWPFSLRDSTPTHAAPLARAHFVLFNGHLVSHRMQMAPFISAATRWWTFRSSSSSFFFFLTISINNTRNNFVHSHLPIYIFLCNSQKSAVVRQGTFICNFDGCCQIAFPHGDCASSCVWNANFLSIRQHSLLARFLIFANLMDKGHIR